MGLPLGPALLLCVWDDAGRPCKMPKPEAPSTRGPPAPAAAHPKTRASTVYLTRENTHDGNEAMLPGSTSTARDGGRGERSPLPMPPGTGFSLPSENKMKSISKKRSCPQDRCEPATKENPLTLVV